MDEAYTKFISLPTVHNILISFLISSRKIINNYNKIMMMLPNSI